MSVTKQVAWRSSRRARRRLSHVHPLQQVGFVVAGWMTLTEPLVAVRRGQLGRAVERVVAGAAGEGLGFQRHGGRPVQRGLVVAARKLALAAQQVALEVVVVAGDDARLIEELNHLPAQVVGLRDWAGFRHRRCARPAAPRPRLRAGRNPSAAAAGRRRCGTGDRGCPRRRAACPPHRSASSARPPPCWPDGCGCRACRSRSA